MIMTPEEKHTQLYKDILEILKANFYPLGEVDDDAQCAEMIAKYFEGYWNEAKLKEELIKFTAWYNGKEGLTISHQQVDKYLKTRSLKAEVESEKEPIVYHRCNHPEKYSRYGIRDQGYDPETDLDSHGHPYH